MPTPFLFLIDKQLDAHSVEVTKAWTWQRESQARQTAIFVFRLMLQFMNLSEYPMTIRKKRIQKSSLHVKREVKALVCIPSSSHNTCEVTMIVTFIVREK